MADYHDWEWARPVLDEQAMFERLCLEAFQAGLSWSLVLTRREALRSGFAGFDFFVLADWGRAEIEAALGCDGVIRNLAKATAVVKNARATKELVQSGGSLVHTVWEAASEAGEFARWADVPSATAESTLLAKRLARAGFSFVGPVSAYATMQASGVVNDHVSSCAFRSVVAEERRRALKRLGMPPDPG